MGHTSAPVPVVSVHTLSQQGSQHEQQTPDNTHRKRLHGYLLLMSLRTGCFVAAVMANGWLRWVLLIASVVVPYGAVLLANPDTRTRGITSQARW